MRYIWIALLLYTNVCLSQSEEEYKNICCSSSTYYANTISVHPFGVFMSRLNNNFKIEADNRISITANISSGNVWLPYVKAYEPIHESDKLAMQNLVWHEREANYDILNTPSKSYELHMDGILRSYQLGINIPLAKNHEFKVNSRFFSIDKGKLPFSFLTGDDFIEWFHSNIAGGEDPFARRDYGLNKVNFFYIDADGNALRVKNGEFGMSGVDMTYACYPEINFFRNKNLYLNTGLQLGINTNKINPTLDCGLNVGLVKKIKFKSCKNSLSAGLSLGALRQGFIRFGDGVEISNKKFILDGELLFEYIRHYKNGNYMSIGTTWYHQSSYWKKSDMDYLVLTGQRITPHWHHSLSHLYRKLSANSIVLTYGKENSTFWVYLREDLLVDNAPDIQTGIGLSFLLR